MQKVIHLLPVAMLLSFLIKIMILTPTISEALVFFSLVAYVVLEQIRLKDKQLAKYDQLVKEMGDKLQHFEQELKNNQASINSVKLGIGVRSVNGQKF